jgi:hypothetical protein
MKTTTSKSLAESTDFKILKLQDRSRQLENRRQLAEQDLYSSIESNRLAPSHVLRVDYYERMLDRVADRYLVVISNTEANCLDA